MPATNVTLIGPPCVDPPVLPLQMGGVLIQLGFPSPAEDFEEGSLDLNRFLVRNPLATYIYRASGWSMAGVGILDGDLLAVDRSVTPRSGDTVIATWEGNQPTCKILQLAENRIELLSGDASHPPIVLEQDIEVEIFAVVGVARAMRRRGASRG